MANPFGDQPAVKTNPFGDAPAEPSLGDKALGALEAGATFASGIVAEPVSGFIGGVGALLPGPEGQGADWVANTQEFMTYQPRGDEGQGYLKDIGESAPVQALASGIEAVEGGSAAVGEAIGGVVGAPGVGYAIGKSAPTAALELLGFKGASKLRGARKVTGIPDSVADDLTSKGIDIDDLSDQGLEKIQQTIQAQTDAEIKRLKAFEAENIPTLQSRVTGSHTDFLSERQLRRADTKEGQLLRRRASEEAAGFQDAVSNYGKSFGIADEAGDSVKEALRARESGLKADVTSAYNALDEATSGQSLPLVGNKIMEVFDDPKIQGMSGRLAAADRKALNDVLIEYGLDTDGVRVGDWVSRRADQSGGVPIKTEITPLSINNFEDLSQALTAMTGPENAAELRSIAGSLKRGVESELDQLDEVITNATEGTFTGGKDALDAAKKARATYRKLKGLQNVKSLTGRLLASKKGAPDEAVILASEVSKKLLSNTADGAIENVTKLVDQLNATEKGAKALGDIQADVGAKLLSGGTSKQIMEGGVNAWNPQGYMDAFDKMSQNGKLDVLFANNPEGLVSLNRLYDLSKSTKMPSEVARFSGTADDLANIMQGSSTFRRIMQIAATAGGGWGAGAAVDVAAAGAKKAKAGKADKASKAAARKALDVKPTDYQAMMQTKRMYPWLYGALLPASASQLPENP